MKAADWIALASGIGGGALGAWSASRNRTQDRELREEQNELTEEQDIRRTALQESLADPFRHQRAQAGALTSLDMIQNFSNGRRIAPPANIAAYSGRPTGNRYQPSATMRDHAGSLFGNVAAGNTAPTMTDPANYGRTGAVNLTAPTAAPGAGGATGVGDEPIDPFSYLSGMERRNEGAGGALSGMAKGAGMGAGIGAYAGGVGAIPGALIGGAAGLIGGAFTKNAKTAMTDITVDQARQAITQVFQREGGRTPTPQEVDQIIAGQGYKPGDWGVGEAGILDVIRNLQANFAQERRGTAA